MAAGLNKATNYYNNLEARKDWYAMCAKAEAIGRPDLIADLPTTEGFHPEQCGWRVLDKYTDMLRDAVNRANNEQTEKAW